MNRIEGSSPSSPIKSGVWVPQVQSCQGFESLKSRVQVPQVKGSSPSSQGFKSLKSRVQVPQVKGSSPSSQGFEALLIIWMQQFLKGQKGSMGPCVSWYNSDDQATGTYIENPMVVAGAVTGNFVMALLQVWPQLA